MFFHEHPDRHYKLWNTLSTKWNCKGVANEKLCKISICWFSESQAALRCKRKEWLDQNKNSLSERSDMSTHKRLSKFYNQACWSGKKWTPSSPSSSHWNVTCSRHDIVEILLCLALYNNHSLPQNQWMAIQVGSSMAQPSLKKTNCYVVMFAFFDMYDLLVIKRKAPRKVMPQPSSDVVW
jgi:hypothetical protein